MKIVRLDNGQFALEVPLWAPFVFIGKNSPINKNTDIITQDMIIKWQTKYTSQNNWHTSTLNHDTGGLIGLRQGVGFCLKCSIYNDEVLEQYINNVVSYGDIKQGQKYFDNGTSWIEVYNTKLGEPIPIICFLVKLLVNKDAQALQLNRKIEKDEIAYWIFDENTKYIFLETLQIFIALGGENEATAKTILRDYGKQRGVI